MGLISILTQPFPVCDKNGNDHNAPAPFRHLNRADIITPLLLGASAIALTAPFFPQQIPVITSALEMMIGVGLFQILRFQFDNAAFRQAKHNSYYVIDRTEKRTEELPAFAKADLETRYPRTLKKLSWSAATFIAVNGLDLLSTGMPNAIRLSTTFSFVVNAVSDYNRTASALNGNWKVFETTPPTDTTRSQDALGCAPS